MYSIYGSSQSIIIYSLSETWFFILGHTGEIVHFKINTHGQIKYNLMYTSRKTEVFYCRLSDMEVDYGVALPN